MKMDGTVRNKIGKKDWQIFGKPCRLREREKERNERREKDKSSTHIALSPQNDALFTNFQTIKL